MKKIAFLLTFLLVFTPAVFTGCGGDQTEQKETEKNTSGEMNEADKEMDIFRFKASVPDFGLSPEGTLVQDEWQKKMEEYMGMKLDIKWERLPWNDYREKEKIILASGDYPDVFTSSDYDNVLEYGPQGMLLEVSQYFDRTPNYMEFVNSTPDAEYQLYDENGKSYGFQDGFANNRDIEGAQSLSTVAYRFDIFKKHSIKVPETLDEFYDAAKKLKEIYPDIYPINISDSGFQIHKGFLNVFHTHDGIYWNGEKFVYGPAEENYKEMLMFINKLYKEGLLDPEFLTDNNDRATEKAVTGRVFMLPSVWAGMANHYNRNAEDATMEWGLAMLPENPKYGTPWKLMSTLPGKSLQQRFNIVISAKAEHPELLVKIVDYQYSDEMIELMNWGIEGKTYEINEDGLKEFLPEIMKADDPAQELGKLGVSSSQVCRSGIVFTPQDFEANIAQLPTEPWYHDGGFIEHQYWIATHEFGGKESVAPFDRAPKLIFTQEESDTKANTMTPVDSYASESRTKFILGEMSFDQWDQYKANLLDMGDYPSILETYNKKVEDK
jgi:putative aldouronate transport system substrate-binding protein